MVLVTPGSCRNWTEKQQIQQKDVIGNIVFLKPLWAFAHVTVCPDSSLTSS